MKGQRPQQPDQRIGDADVTRGCTERAGVAAASTSNASRLSRADVPSA